MIHQRISVDITPKGTLSEESLQRYRAAAIGRPYRNERGDIVGEIRRVMIENGRLIAEVQTVPGVILG